MQRSVRFGGLALAVALILGACGGGGGNKAASTSSSSSSTGTAESSSSSSSSGGGDSVEACKLSEGDVSDIMGFTLKKQDSSNPKDCTFTAEQSDTDHLGATVSFDVSSFGGSPGDAKIAADAIASAFNVSPVDIPGVGDKSFFIDAGIVGELVVFSGKSQVTIAVGGLGDSSARQDQLVKLAKKLLS